MIASTFLDPLIHALRHHEQQPAGTYRLIRPTFRFACDADTWLWGRNLAWPSASARRHALGCWIVMRRRHHVAWLERGGVGQ